MSNFLRLHEVALQQIEDAQDAIDCVCDAAFEEGAAGIEEIEMKISYANNTIEGARALLREAKAIYEAGKKGKN